MKEIMPGDRVLVFDPRVYKDDITTPFSHTVRPATVVCRYGMRGSNPFSIFSGDGLIYSDLIDVVFDHRPGQVSNGHFTGGVKFVEE